MIGLKAPGGTGFINGIVSYVQKGGIVSDTKKRGGAMRKFKIRIKCTQEMTLELPAEAYGDENITAERIAEMERENVESDPTYFNFNENSTMNVEVDVDEVTDA